MAATNPSGILQNVPGSWSPPTPCTACDFAEAVVVHFGLLSALEALTFKFSPDNAVTRVLLRRSFDGHSFIRTGEVRDTHNRATV